MKLGTDATYFFRSFRKEDNDINFNSKERWAEKLL